MLDKLKMESLNMTQANIEKIGALFPNVITESKDEQGKLIKAINFDKLKQELSDEIIDNSEESYDFTWVGKNEAIVEANTPIRKTLRPCIEESKNFETTENLYIEGDNLDVLKLLQESYLNSVKMIYIDPPYNTGKDFIYKDNFRKSSDEYDEESGVYDDEGNVQFVQNNDTNPRFHSDWCSMIYPRLRLAKNLLTDDGVIFISINDYEVENLRKICNEIFGERNFIATLIWDKNHSAQAGIYKVYHEYVLVFCKNIDYMGTPISLSNELFEAGAMKKESGRHPLSTFTFPKGTRFDAKDGFELTGTYGETEKVRIVSGRMIAQDNKLLEDVTLEAGFTQANQMRQFFYGDKETLVDSQGQKIVEFYLNSTGKIKVVKRRGVETPQTTCKFGTQGMASTELTNLFQLDESPFSSPKPVTMLTDFIQRFTQNDDIILDFFSGSATTAHGVFLANANSQLNRRFILVQLQEDLDHSLKQAQKDTVNTLKIAVDYLDSLRLPHLLTEIGKERIRRAGDKIKSEIESANAQIKLGEEEKKCPDIGFRVLKLDDTNMKDVYYGAGEIEQSLLDDMVSNIKEDRNDIDLLYGVLLDWGLQLSSKHEILEIEGVRVHNYDDLSLVACFENKINESVVRKIASLKNSNGEQPLRVVFRDSSFENSPDKINVEEIFKLNAPNTSVKVI